LTDGVNNSGQVNPLRAAEIAHELGVKVHTIGIGSPDTQRRLGVQAQEYEFDEKTLRKIAETTGGVYFNASSIEGLRAVYDEIDRLEAVAAEESAPQSVEEQFPLFA